jgi:D-3-phosphoglycerate dehydrogenase/(S)-sulfolactate dehydrogenase
VLITLPYLQPGDEVDERLRQAGAETVFSPWHGKRTEAEMIDILKDVDAVVAFLDPFTATVIRSADRLKVISRSGVGYDNVDVEEATARGIAVCNTPGLNSRAVAEFTIAMMLNFSRRIPENLAEMRQGAWNRYQGKDLSDFTVGIAGTGSIGRQVARLARAFDMRILAWDAVRDEAFAEQHGVEYVGLEELLRKSDFVTLHLLLNEGTQHLINEETLALMKPTAYLINTARGGLVDTAALVRALERKAIAGAALDAFEQEPLEPDSPLRGLDNAYLTAHVAGVTSSARRPMAVMAAENALRVLGGELPGAMVNPEVLKGTRGSAT